LKKTTFQAVFYKQCCLFYDSKKSLVLKLFGDGVLARSADSIQWQHIYVHMYIKTRKTL